MVRRLDGEDLMNKSSKDNASRLGHITFEDRTLDDAELTAVTGGKPATGGGKSTGISESISLSFEEVKFKYTQQTG
jgi:hypothetical protein